ncbi:KH domain-containing protein [Quillaja saponaria]|uniref:KH domain-containing protein n=1 Tax=Quillaja saponaria TaxID=32244 RepID=A0AAD7LKS3_QUISA|nr:KH domain-containing protein [Quillaja saponaria]
MSGPLTPSKRPNDGSLAEPNGKGKWQKLASHSQSLKCSHGTIAVRLLCPSSKIGSFLGDSGHIISQIHQETGGKVRVEETVPGCDERVIAIVGSDKETEEDTEQSKEVGNEEITENEKEEDVETKGNDENDEAKDSVPVEALKSEKATLQKALFLIFERLVEGEGETNDGDEENNKSSSFVLRLLVLSSQVGCILGKGGSVIKQMSSESGAQIRILPRDKLPPCASASDELVQITGEIEAVRKALQSVSQQLLENPPRDHESISANLTGSSSHSFGRFPPPNRSFTGQGGPYPAGYRDLPDFHSAPPHTIPKFHEGIIPSRFRPLEEMLTFRLLCHDERVGGIIGKGGAIIRTLQQETCCEIKVMEGISGSEDRLVIVSGPAHPDDRISPVQDAVLRVQTRIVRAIPDSKEQSVLARILVSSNQIGCLLGKGGSVISEMRKLSGAHIRIIGKDQVPKFASEDEEVVQVNGEFEAVQDALLQITTRLRHHFFRDAFPSINYPSTPAFLDQLPPFPPYMGRRELSPPGIHSNLGPPFHKFDSLGAHPSHGGFHPHDDRPPFMHDGYRLGVPPYLSERKPWGPQGLIEGGGPLGMPDFARAPPRRLGGFAGGSHQPIITSTTVEVVVPRSVVPVIYGEDGECLKQILQISDAKITITDPKPGAMETVIIIAGTPEQTHAAQSLIQAFVVCETESS